MPSLIADVREGCAALRGAPAAVRLLGADMLSSAVYGVLTVTLVLTSRRIGAGAGGYGILLGAMGIGGVLGASVAGRVRCPSAWWRTLAIALALVAVGLVAMGMLPTLAGALAGALLAGGGMVVSEVLSDAALPTMLDDAVLARAYGLIVPTSLGGIVVGSLVAGPLVTLLGLPGALAAVAVVALGAAALLGRRGLSPVAAPDETQVVAC